MDMQEPSQLGRPWEKAMHGLDSPKKRARWLWEQLTPRPRATTSVGPTRVSRATRNEWAVFLEDEGVPHERAIEMASGTGTIADWKRQLNRVFVQLNKGIAHKLTLRTERTWTLSKPHITSTRLPLNSDDVLSFIVTLAIDCLVPRLCCCARKRCHEIFMVKGKQKFCSRTCALSVAKQRYRVRMQLKESSS